MRPRMWSGTVHVGFSAGTWGSYGTMRSTRDVMSDTGPDTCGPCGVHVLHNSPSTTSTIATLPHPGGCIMVVGALYTFPSQAKSGDISRSTLTYVSSEYHWTLHVQVNYYFTRSQPVSDHGGENSHAPGLHQESYYRSSIGLPTQLPVSVVHVISSVLFVFGILASTMCTVLGTLLVTTSVLVPLFRAPLERSRMPWLPQAGGTAVWCSRPLLLHRVT